MSSHCFNFEGGEYLTAMGASWFVSYKYYEIVDNCHENWKLVNTYNNRIRVFSNSYEFHVFWLHEILKMNDKKLNTNKIKLRANEIKQMARSILSKIS